MFRGPPLELIPQRCQCPDQTRELSNSDAFIATVDNDSRVHFAPVSVSSNDGREVTFANGATVGERVALNVGSAVADGERVQTDSSSGAVASASTKPAPDSVPSKTAAGAGRK